MAQFCVTDETWLHGSRTVEVLCVRVDWSVTTEHSKIGLVISALLSDAGSCATASTAHGFGKFGPPRSAYFLCSTATKNPPEFCLCGNIRMLEYNINASFRHKWVQCLQRVRPGPQETLLDWPVVRLIVICTLLLTLIVRLINKIKYCREYISVIGLFRQQKNGLKFAKAILQF